MSAWGLGWSVSRGPDRGDRQVIHNHASSPRDCLDKKDIHITLERLQQVKAFALGTGMERWTTDVVEKTTGTFADFRRVTGSWIPMCKTYSCV